MAALILIVGLALGAVVVYLVSRTRVNAAEQLATQMREDATPRLRRLRPCESSWAVIVRPPCWSSQAYEKSWLRPGPRWLRLTGTVEGRARGPR